MSLYNANAAPAHDAATSRDCGRGVGRATYTRNKKIYIYTHACARALALYNAYIYIYTCVIRIYIYIRSILPNNTRSCRAADRKTKRNECRRRRRRRCCGAWSSFPTKPVYTYTYIHNIRRRALATLLYNAIFYGLQSRTHDDGKAR